MGGTKRSLLVVAIIGVPDVGGACAGAGQHAAAGGPAGGAHGERRWRTDLCLQRGRRGRQVGVSSTGGEAAGWRGKRGGDARRRAFLEDGGWKPGEGAAGGQQQSAGGWGYCLAAAQGQHA